MQRVGVLWLVFVAVVLPAFVPATAAASAPTAIGTGGAAASVDRDATRTAIAVLRSGGNAVDAAVAANATLGVTEPYVAGIGGGGFLVIYLARDHRVVTIDGRETAPLAMPQDAFIDPDTGKPYPFTPQRVTSGMAVGVPGTLASWVTAEKRFGTIRLRKLLQPAIRVARRGFLVDQTFHDQTQDNLERLGAFASSRSLFLTPDGQAPAVGTRVRNPDLARTYRLLARQGPDAFYRGPIGAAVANTADHPPVDRRTTRWGSRSALALMNADDLARYTSPLGDPTHVSYRGLDVYGMAPPSSGGSTVGEALNILEGYDMSTPDRALALHRYIEALRLAYADRNRFVGDPQFVERAARWAARRGLRSGAPLPDRTERRDQSGRARRSGAALRERLLGRAARRARGPGGHVHQPPHRGGRAGQHRQLDHHD